MLQLDILSGKQAGSRIVARRFPFSIGRSQNDNLQLNDPGVWDHHCSIDLDRASSAFQIETNENSSLIINGNAGANAVLRNGDLLQLGAATIRIEFTVPIQQSLVLREVAMWVGLVLLCLAQVFVFYWLTQ